jgi:hypothetical protein
MPKISLGQSFSPETRMKVFRVKITESFARKSDALKNLRVHLGSETDSGADASEFTARRTGHALWGRDREQFGRE